MAIWHFRGVLESEWQERKEAVDLTIEEIVKLGIESAEKEKQEAK